MIKPKQILLDQQVLFIKSNSNLSNNLHFSIFYSTDYKCKYCMKDFHRKQNLYNHLYKTKCGTDHPPNTSANYWAEKRDIPCPQPGCNGSYTTQKSLDTHLSDRHNIHKSTRKLKVQGRQAKGNVCTYNPNRKNKNGKKTRKKVNFCIKQIR